MGHIVGNDRSVNSRRNKMSRAAHYALEQMEERWLLSAPNAPYALSATAENGAVLVQFTDNANNETGFVVLRSNGNNTYTQIATLPAASGVHSVVSYTDDTIAANSTYNYEVYAVINSTPSSTTGPVTVSTSSSGGGGGAGYGTTPNAPFGLAASASGANVVLSFYNNANNDTGFVVYRATGGGTAQQIGTVAASTVVDQQLSYTDTTAQPGTTYQYSVVAVDGALQSSVAGPINFTTSGNTQVTPPNGPYNLTATAESNGSVQLSFIDNANNESNFIVQRATSGGTFNTVATLPPSPGTGQTVTYTDTTAAAGTSYQYRVYAVNTAGNSYYSNVASVTTSGQSGGGTGDGNPGGVPNAPFSLVALPANDNAVSLSFVDNSTSETGFIVERATSPGGPYTQIATLPASPGKDQTVTYADTSTEGNAGTYSYEVVAVNGSVQSSASGPATVTTSYVTLTLPNGQVLVTKTDTTTPDDQAVLITRYNANGTIDTSYGSDGTLSIPSDNEDLNQIGALALLPSGSVVAVIQGGISSDNPYSETRLALVNASGQLASTRVIASGDADSTHDTIGDLIAVGSNGQIFVAGNYIDAATEYSEPFPLIVDAFNSDLSPVSTFGDDGRVQVDTSVTGSSTPQPTQLVANNDGSVTVTYTNASDETYTLTLSSTGEVET